MLNCWFVLVNELYVVLNSVFNSLTMSVGVNDGLFMGVCVGLMSTIIDRLRKWWYICNC